MDDEDEDEDLMAKKKMERERIEEMRKGVCRRNKEQFEALLFRTAF